jgi:UPF0597 protein CLOHYLEM_07041
MNKDDIRYTTYVQILKEELIPAMGCTEPIALAYAAAKAREVLGKYPQKVLVEASGSIIKNVKSVIVPNTGHLKGIPAAVAAGIVAGDANRKLEVISDVDDSKKSEIASFLKNIEIDVLPLDMGYVFDLIITLFYDCDYVKVRIVNQHTNIVLIEKNNDIILETEIENNSVSGSADRDLLTMEGIWDFINSMDVSDVKDTLDKQIFYNTSISEEGLLGNYGANIGSVLLNTYGNDIKVRAKAKAAAGSDARMNGCELPVVINSGSGNQGITCSIPVIEYAKELKVSKDKLYRALALSNLTSIHQKHGIGTLSAYCGAVSAGAGAGAGIAYLTEGSLESVEHTVVNTLAIVSGIVCDGAKASCAAKIASSVDAAIMGLSMYKDGQAFHGGDGIVMNNIEETIKGISKIGKDGMRETNNEIIKLMVENN